MMALRRAATAPRDWQGTNKLPWKYEYVHNRALELTTSGSKVIVWSNFIDHIDDLSEILAEFSPSVVHGGVPSKRFHQALCLSLEHVVHVPSVQE